MENSNDMKPNYKIWHFGKTQWDRVVDERFYAKSDNEAYCHLVDFMNKTPVFDGKTFYYASIHYTYMVDENGNHSQAFDIDNLAERIVWRKSNAHWLKRAFDEIVSFFEYYFVDKPKDLYYWTRDFVYLLKNKEEYSNQWNLDMHLLDSIERNVPSLIKNSHSLSFIDQAILRMHAGDPNFNLKEYHKAHYAGYPKEVEDLAIKIQNEEYANLLLYVKLYRYYANTGSIDFDNREDVEFDRKWRHTLPIKKGTYDEIADYDKILELSQRYWDKIWDWMKFYGQTLSD